MDVIASYSQLVVGAILVDFTDPWRRQSTARGRVLREVTEADYHACLTSYGISDDTPWFAPVWFYEVSID